MVMAELKSEKLREREGITMEDKTIDFHGLHKKSAKVANVSGFAAAQCGKAKPYRAVSVIVGRLRLHISEA